MKRFWLCCLLLLLLALPALCQAEGTPVSLNDMIKTDSERIELRFLDSKNNAKTDATLLLCYGKERLEVLERRIRELGMNPEDYWWYCDLRRYGSCKHAGFGLGFERMVMYLTGVSNIRDVELHPRTVGNADF